MKNNRLYLNGLFLAAFCFFSNALRAQVAFDYLDINNVKVVVKADGNLFQMNDIPTSQYGPGFEVPKGGGKHTIYASGLWIGGLETGGALHTACQTYKQIGNDFIPGPVGVASTGVNLNKVWKVNRSAINDFIANHAIPNYIIPQEIIDWPGNVGSTVYAPFVDVNNNGMYEPIAGDYPSIKGDQAIYFVFNDSTTHSESNGLPLLVEVHGMAYAFNNPNFPELNNTVFVEQRIKNKSAISLNSTYVSMWNDFDLGNPNDDLQGTDVQKNMIFAYNADSVDEGPNGYGSNPPAMGVTFLNQPLSNSIMYKNDFSFMGNPSTAQQFYNYMQSIYKDGSHLQYGSSGVNCNYVYPGSSDSAFAGQYWAQAATDLFDSRVIGSYGPFTFPAGSVIDLDVAYIFHRDTATSVSGLRNAAANVKYLYDSGVLGINSVSQNAVLSMQVSPNPMVDKASIAFNNSAHENFTLKLMDANGRIVYEQKNIVDNFVELKRNELPQGLYLLMLQSGNKILSSKITLQ